jgi:4-hydroxythreonine-4-phosphate dehydrogenase
MSPETLKIGITIGDINGIGPEIILKTLADSRMLQGPTIVVYGSSRVLNFYRKGMEAEEPVFHGIKSADQALPKKANLISITKDEIHIEPGQVTAQAGQLAFLSLELAVKDLESNKIDALVTCPINKKNIQSKDFNFPGHTEYLAKYSNVDEALMFMCSDTLRVGIVTGHVPLKEVSRAITKKGILGKLDAMNKSLKLDFSLSKPRIAVLGLNPHAGDDGLLGTEEKEIIIPAIQEARGQGIFAFGPYAADGFFAAGTYRQFDAVLAMYHDQGLVPFKAIAGDMGVNFTAGLPIVRTSPAHGTAYDLAGKGLASENSLRQAIYTAADVYLRRRENKILTANPLAVSEKD